MSIVSDVQTWIADTGVFWPADNVYDAINEAQVDLYADAKYVISTATMTLTASTDIFSLPTAIMLPQWIERGGKKYFPTSQIRLEQYTQEWRKDPAATPKFFVVWDASHLRSYPKPDATYEFLLCGVPWPAEVASTNTDISGDRTYKDAVAFKAASLLMEATRPDVAEAFEKESQSALLSYRKTLRRQLPLIRLRPGSKFTVAQSGDVKVGNRYS